MYPDWTIQQIKDCIDSGGRLENYQSGIILLNIGTNDIRQGMVRWTKVTDPELNLYYVPCLSDSRLYRL